MLFPLIPQTALSSFCNDFYVLVADDADSQRRQKFGQRQRQAEDVRPRVHACWQYPARAERAHEKSTSTLRSQSYPKLTIQKTKCEFAGGCGSTARWICLAENCGTALCGKLAHNHSNEHNKQNPSHYLQLTNTGRIWCFACNKEVQLASDEVRVDWLLLRYIPPSLGDGRHSEARNKDEQEADRDPTETGETAT